MWRLRRFLLRLVALATADRAERELVREIHAHQTLLEDAYRRRGLSPDEARLAARRALGGIEQAKEHQRDARSFRWLDDLGRDVRYSTRSLQRTPGFTSVTLLTLALGIGANTTIFSIVYPVLIKPLPYKDASRLVRLIEHIPASQSPDGSPVAPRRSGVSVSVRELVEIRRSTRSITHAGVSTLAFMTVIGGEQTARLEGARVSPDILQMRGVPPLLGRLFDDGEEAPGADGAIILSYATWRQFFGASPNVLGRSLTLEDAFAREPPRTYVVIGVMPEGYESGGQNQFWIPLAVLASGGASPRGGLVARLDDGVSSVAAAAEIGSIMLNLRGTQQDSAARAAAGPPRYELVPIQDPLVEGVKPALLVLTVAVGFVLLIACVNVASLILARTVSRQRELAIRVALGAGRGRLIRHQLTESLMLALGGGLAGTLLAFGGSRVLRVLATTLKRMDLGVQLSFPRLDEVGIDVSVLAFTALICTLTGVLCGLAPALRRSHSGRPDTLSNREETADAGFSSRARLRGFLVVAQIAMAMMLLVGGGLLIRSFVTLAAVDPGYEPADVVTFQVGLSRTRYPGAELRTFAEALVTRVRSIPGVDSAAYARQLPMIAIRESAWFRKTPDLPDPPPPQPTGAADARLVSQDYFDVLRIRIVAGRGFGEEDAAGRPRVLIINETLARREFPATDPIGQHVYAGRDAVPWQIVGIAADVRQFGLDREPQPQFFADLRQWPDEDRNTFTFLGPYYAVRTPLHPDAIVPRIREIARGLDPESGVFSVATMEQLVSNSIARPRMYATVLGVFAGIALLFAAVGIYGTMAYSVAQRTREIGIRMALGAQRREVITLVLGRSGAEAAGGIVLGIAGALALTRYLEGMLFGLTALDPATFGSVSAFFLFVAGIAALVPARRATRIDPLVALRHD